MPRNASGTYTLPAGNPVDAGTVIEAAWANTTLEDLGNEITNSLSRTGEGGMLAPFRLADGTLAAPGIAWLNEPSTGFYRAGAGEMWGVVSGSQVLQYTANGILVPTGKTFTAQGNVTVGGTLAVTGAATLSSTLAVTGAITATGGVVGNVTGNVTGNLTGNVTGNVSGNAGTVTNGVYTTGSYADPSWLTSLAGTKITGNISGNAGNVTGTVAIANGGTGQTTANAALNALLPSQTSQSGKYLKTDGTNASWDQLDISTADITGTLPIVNGGTGATTASGARTALGLAIGTDVPSPTGTGASGTWGISVTGNAATATALQNSRTIWGQSFNGTANVSGALTGVTDLTASGNGSFGGTFGVTGVTTLADNLVFSGSGKRITGDFSNATLANRVMIQSSTMNGNTAVTVIPNGTATTGTFRAYNNSDPTNASFVQISAQATSMRVESGISGSGTYRDLTFLAGASGQFTLDTSGNLTLASPGTFTYSSGTANGVAYLNGSKVLATGSALTFDGTNLGVGTNAPLGLLDVASASATYARVRATTATAAATYYQNSSSGTTNTDGLFVGIDGSLNGYLYNYENAPLIFGINSLEQMRLTSSGLEVKQSQLIGYSSYAGIGTNGLAVAGNVGIGTSSPGVKLDVAGTDVYRVFKVSTATGGSIEAGLLGQSTIGIQSLTNAGNFQNLLLQPNGGNVGIGTSSPGAKLHSVVADGSYPLAVSGTTKGVRFETNSTETRIVGVDNTLTASFQPLSLGGSQVIVRTNGSTQAAVFDASGNLGLGVTPSAWGSIFKVMQVGAGASYIGGRTDTVAGRQVWLGTNSFYNGTNWIYSLSQPAAQYYQNDGSHIWNTAPSGTAGNAISFTQALTLNANGALVLQGGNTSASGVGVAFPATQSASSDANTLDDYEEGTWLPTVDGITATYGNRTGRYTKIGNFVIASAFIDFVSITSADGGDLTISGFPFAADSSGVFYSGTFGNFQNIDLDANTVQVAWNIGSSATTSILRNIKDNAAFATLPNTRISASTSMYITWTYRV